MSKNWFENDTGVIHLAGHSGAAYTLCGAEQEEGMSGNPMSPSARKVTCGDCLDIVLHCRRVPMTAFAAKMAKVKR